MGNINVAWYLRPLMFFAGIGFKLKDKYDLWRYEQQCKRARKNRLK